MAQKVQNFCNFVKNIQMFIVVILKVRTLKESELPGVHPYILKLSMLQFVFDKRSND